MGALRLGAFSLALLIVLALALPAIGQSPNEALFNAVEVNDVDAVEAAITAGADLAAKNADGMTPADVAAVGFHGQTVLHRAPAPGLPGRTRQLGDGRAMADRLEARGFSRTRRSLTSAISSAASPLSYASTRSSSL